MVYLARLVLRRVITLLCFAIFGLVFVYQRRLLHRYSKDLKTIRTADDKVVTTALLGNLRYMTNIALPQWTSKEGLTSLGFIGLFLIRSILYVMGSHADGKIMELILASAKGHASKGRLAGAVSFFAGVKLMQAATGGAIEHVRHHLIASYRKILTHHFHNKFFEKLTYYHATAIDSRMRLEAADTVIPIYCGEFAEHFAELPYYFVMPFFDATVSLLEVIRQVGPRPAAGLLGIAGVFLAGLKALTPPFGRIHALMLHREEEFKKKHTDVQTSVEQIALMDGGAVSKGRANYSFEVLMRSLEQMAAAKGSFKLLEDAVGGCLWELVGFLVSWSVVNSRASAANTYSLGGGRVMKGSATAGKADGIAAKIKAKIAAAKEQQQQQGGGLGAADKLLSSMVVQRRLVTDFHVAITAMVVNIKEVSHLSEFTEKLAEFDRTLDSIARGEFARYVGVNNTAAAAAADGGAAASGPAVVMDALAASSLLNPIAKGSTEAGTHSSITAGSPDPNNHRGAEQQQQQQIASGSFNGTTLDFADSFLMKSASMSLGPNSAARGETRPSDDAAAATAAAIDAATAKQWDIPELAEDGWVPCVMSPALHHASYTRTNTAAAAPTATATAAVSSTASSSSAAAARTITVTDPLVRFINTDVSTPNGKLLIKQLNLTWSQGQSWAVSGPNGCGKSSLLRVLAQTWLPSGGEVGIHDRVKFIYVPQTPYFPPDATLAEQVMYPDVPTLVRFEVVDVAVPSKDAAAAANSSQSQTVIHRRAVVKHDAETNANNTNNDTNSAEPMTSLSAPSDATDLMVCPHQQRCMKEALLLATGRQLLHEVIHGWHSPTSGLYNPHRRFVRREGEDGEAAPQQEGSKHSPQTPTVGSGGSDSANADAATAPSVVSTTHGVFSGCDRSLSWPSLSGGQQQKLALSRAFYHSLKAIQQGFIPIIVMDESTSQMDEASEDAIFANLKSRGIDMLSVSHRKEVVLRHTHILQLARDPCAWRLVEVDENTVNEALEI